MNITQKIIKSHLVSGSLEAGSEIAIKIDQTLTQDATGTMAWLQFEALGVDTVRTELSVSYVDHNTLQMGFRNPDDHRFLKTSAARFGAVFSPAGTGICHQLHLENFGKPCKTLLGSDSHTPTGGGLGMLAMGAGGLSVALAMAGKAYTLSMPKVVGVCLKGKLQGFVQAKDIILHLLSLLTVKGGVGKVFEYYGEGVDSLTVPERATIANMGAELGATASLFPSDEQTALFLKSMGREEDFVPLHADDTIYDEYIEINLSKIEPLASCPSMPDIVKTVAELAKEMKDIPVNQVCIGSCTNSSYADISQVVNILKNKHVCDETDVNLSPGSRQVLSMIAHEGKLESLIDAGVRILECSCGPCIGMGSSPVSAGVSVRTFNRNFEGRSGTKDAQVFLVSPVTAAFCALHGKFTDPATWVQQTDKISNIAFPDTIPSIRHHFIFPLDKEEDRKQIEIKRGPNIVALDTFIVLPKKLSLESVIKLGSDITTDHIMPAGAEITALRSNIPAISMHVFERVDADFAKRCLAIKSSGKSGIIIAGENYGQGSSREHAALAPRHLGVSLVLAQSFARIHRTNLINFGIIPLLFHNKQDYDVLTQGKACSLDLTSFTPQKSVSLVFEDNTEIPVFNDLTQAEWEIIQAGGFLNYIKNEL